MMDKLRGDGSGGMSALSTAMSDAAASVQAANAAANQAQNKPTANPAPPANPPSQTTTAVPSSDAFNKDLYGNPIAPSSPGVGKQLQNSTSSFVGTVTGYTSAGNAAASFNQGNYLDAASWELLALAQAATTVLPLSGAISKAAGAVENAVSNLSSSTSSASTFWSGPGTSAAADSWAAANGGQTLSMTELAVGSDAGPVAVANASRTFASTASGDVQVFQAAGGVRIQSVWAQVEYPTLLQNPKVTSITYQIIDSTGKVISTVKLP